MLLNINPLLTGPLLRILDEMGHSDHLVIADANFPAHRVCPGALEFPGVDVPQMAAAIAEVFPLDPDHAPVLMDSGDAQRPSVQAEMLAAVGALEGAYVDRWEYYDLAKTAVTVISTGERRLWANIVLYKGVV